MAWSAPLVVGGVARGGAVLAHGFRRMNDGAAEMLPTFGTREVQTDRSLLRQSTGVSPVLVIVFLMTATWQVVLGALIVGGVWSTRPGRAQVYLQGNAKDRRDACYYQNISHTSDDAPCEARSVDRRRRPFVAEASHEILLAVGRRQVFDIV